MEDLRQMRLSSGSKTWRILICVSQLLFVFAISSGCAGVFKQKLADKEFYMRKVLVLTGPSLPKNGFRKIQRSQPVTWEDTVVFAHSYEGLFAYNSMTGRKLWSVSIADGVEASGSSFKSRLYIGGMDGKFRSIDLKTGKVYWEYNAQSEILSQPGFDSQSGTVFFLSGANSIYALNADSGTLLWQYNRPETSSFTIRGGAKPAIENGIVYAGFSDGSLAALNAQNGSVLWENQISKAKKFQDIDASPILDSGLVLSAGFEGSLTAVNQKTGALVWQAPLSGLYADATADGDILYLSSPQGLVTAVKKGTGEKIWQYDGFKGVPSKPALTRGILLVADSSGPIRALDSKSGTLLGSLDLGRGVLSPFAIDSQRRLAYFSTSEGHFYSIEFGYRTPYWIPHILSP